MKIFSIITARGGSKGLPGKNLRQIAGHPLIAHTIRHSLKNRLIHRTICSTDSLEIASVAKKYGAEVPFIRPSEFAEDWSTDLEVFFHALSWLKEHGELPDIVVHLRPTSPIRSQDITSGCINLLLKRDELDSVRSVVESQETPYKMWFIDNDNSLSPVIKQTEIFEPYNTARQLLPKAYLQCANVDVIRSSTILNKKSMTGHKIGAFLINQEFFHDIDTLEDFERAEKILSEHL